MLQVPETLLGLSAILSSHNCQLLPMKISSHLFPPPAALLESRLAVVLSAQPGFSVRWDARDAAEGRCTLNSSKSLLIWLRAAVCVRCEAKT